MPVSCFRQSHAKQARTTTESVNYEQDSYEQDNYDKVKIKQTELAGENSGKFYSGFTGLQGEDL
jgi:hypothetical protein